MAYCEGWGDSKTCEDSTVEFKKSASLKRLKKELKKGNRVLSLRKCSQEVLKLFEYGPRYTPEQNRSLASLRNALERIK